MNTPRYIESQIIAENSEKNFTIEVFELTNICPFEVKRVYTLKTAEHPENRGRHAHLNQLQMLFLLQGSVTIQLTDTFGLESEWVLGQKGLFVPSNYWIELSMDKESMVLCFASQPFLSLETEYSKDRFLKM